MTLLVHRLTVLLRCQGGGIYYIGDVTVEGSYFNSNDVRSFFCLPWSLDRAHDDRGSFPLAGWQPILKQWLFRMFSMSIASLGELLQYKRLLQVRRTQPAYCATYGI